jgi:uncharacterized damage-inducible protein DinB
MLQHFLSQLEYNYWANTRVLQSILRIEQEGNTPPQKTVELFSHILNAEIVWVSRIKSEQIVPPWRVIPLEEMASIIEENYIIYKDFINLLFTENTSSTIHTTLDYTDTKGNEWSLSYGDVLTHVFNHATYHRGQIAMIIRAEGFEPSSTDFILTARKSRN